MAFLIAVDAAVPLQEDNSKDVGIENITHTSSSSRVGAEVGGYTGHTV